MTKKKKLDNEEYEKKKREDHLKSLLIARDCIEDIRATQRAINNSKKEFLTNSHIYKSLRHDVERLFSAMHSSKIVKVRQIIINDKKFIITNIRSIFVKTSSEIKTPILDIKGSEDIIPQNLWERFLAPAGGVDQCEEIINEYIKEDAELAILIKNAASKQEFHITKANQETSSHHKNVINRIKESLEVNLDRVAALCRLLPATPKEKFSDLLKVVFRMDVTAFEASIDNLLKSNVLIETPSYYLVEDHSFAIQSVENFQTREDLRGVHYKIKEWEKANGN